MSGAQERRAGSEKRTGSVGMVDILAGKPIEDTLWTILFFPLLVLLVLRIRPVRPDGNSSVWSSQSASGMDSFHFSIFQLLPWVRLGSVLCRRPSTSLQG